MKLNLSRPFHLDGKEVTEIEADFDNMTGFAIENALKIVTLTRHVVTMQESDPVLHAAIFAEAAGMNFDDVRRLPGKDYLAAGVMVRNFLYIPSAAISEEKTSEE